MTDLPTTEQSEDEINLKNETKGHFEGVMSICTNKQPFPRMLAAWLKV